MSRLFVCFVTLVIQGGAMAKFWPLHHYNQCMGENRRKTLSTARVGEGACQPDIFTKYRLTRLPCVLSVWDMSLSLCVLCNPCYSRWCYGQILAIAPPTITMATKQRIGWDMFHTLSSQPIAVFGENIRLTRPLSHKLC